MVRGLAGLLLVLGAAGAINSGGGPAFAADLSVTQPHHFRAGPPAPLAPLDARALLPIQSLPTQIRGSNLLYKAEDRGFAAFKAEPELSRLCRERRFRQVRDRLFIVRLDGRIYGAALGGHWGLHDHDKKGLPGMIYAIRRQGSTRCEVRRIGPLGS